MGLADRLEEESRGSTPGPDCGVSAFLASLEEPDRTDIVDALGRTLTIKTSVIQRAIKDEYDRYVSLSSLQRHRNGQCKCGRRS